MAGPIGRESSEVTLAPREDARDGASPGELAVLVIDPNEEHQVLSTMALGRRGFRVTIAGTASEGIRLAMSQTFAAIVLDAKVRDLPALEVLSVLAKRVSDVPKIFVVASGQEATAVRALDSGAAGYLVKTARYNELLPSEVESQIRAARARKSLREQKKALDQSEERFQKAFRASPLAICLTTRDVGRFFDANDAFLQLLGYSREEVIGHTAAELGIYLDDADFERVRESVETTGSLRDAEAHMRTKGGEARTVSLSVETIEVEGTPCSLTLFRDVTEERKALQERERESRRFHTMIGHISDGISLVGPDGLVSWQSPSASRMFGYPPEETIGRNGFDFVHPDDAARLSSVFAALISDPGRNVAAEFRIRRKDGAWRWVEAIATNLMANPDVHAVVLTYRDTTERNEALEQIRFQASLLSQVRNAVIATDEGLHIIYWNEAARAMYGWTAAEAIGKPLQALLIPSDDRARAEALLRSVREVGHWEGERAMRRKDGSSFPAEVAITTLRDRNDVAIGYVGVSSDITERTQSRRELEIRARQQAAIADLGRKALVEPLVSSVMNEAVSLLASTLEIEFASVLQLLPDEQSFMLKASVGWDLPPEGRIANDPRGTMAGYTLATKKPVVMDDAENEDRFAVPELFIDRAILSGVAVLIPALPRPFGILSAHSRGKRQFTEDDVHFCESIANVIADALERSRIEKTLAENERMASMGQLAAYVAHEVNTPLTNISLLTSNIARREKDPVILQKLEDIGEQRRKATAIITEILEFPRQRSSRRVPEDVRKVVAAAVDQIAPFRKPDVELVVETGEHAVFANIDVIQIRDVFVNLLKNALQATARGRVRVTLKDWPDFLFVSVEDTGTGIPREVLGQLFHSLASAKSAYEGADSGLVLSRSIVAAHGGKIEATSEVGKGSTFTVILPRFEAH